jgi:hypothetical protein
VAPLNADSDGAGDARVHGKKFRTRSESSPWWQREPTVPRYAIVPRSRSRGATMLDVTGRCHCGDIAFEATVDPARVTICHCTDCQRLTGTAYRVTVPAPSASFRLLRGAVTTYVKTGSSGRQRVHGFCPRCGSPIYSAAPNDPPTYGLRVGSLDQRAELPPKKRIWCRSALPWSESIADVPGVAQE